MKFFVAWNTRKVHYSSFSFKDNIKRFRSANYEDNCSCGENYIGKSVRDAGIRWYEHGDSNKMPLPGKHLQLHPVKNSTQNTQMKDFWRVLSN